MKNFIDLIRPDLRDFAGYSSAASEADGAKPSIKLDANESPWPPFGPVASLCEPHRYAESQPRQLRERLGAYWGVGPDEILLTCGSDQGIDVLLRLFCAYGHDSILVCPPTFAMYEVYARLQGVSTLKVPLLENGQLDIETISKTILPATKLVFIPAPNAPMGHSMATQDIVRVCSLVEGQGLVVVDEAYVEFSSNPQGFVAYLNKIPNLVILRTLSKTHALAGERVGCVIASQEIVSLLRRVMPPYPLSQSAIRAAMDAVSTVGLAQTMDRIKLIRQEAEYLSTALSSVDGIRRVYPSETNFLFIETDDAPSFLRRLKSLGILVRSMEAQKQGCVRVAVASPVENDLLLSALGMNPNRKVKGQRTFAVQRRTKETSIEAFVNLDDPAPVTVSTGLGFIDHMIAQLAQHGGFSLSFVALGDLGVDPHHTIEDCGLVLGEALRSALADKKGIARFGFSAPLDEARADVVLDLSGRPFAKVLIDTSKEAGDGISPDLIEHFFRSFSTTLAATLHIEARGDNNHHVTEAAFKAVGRALRQAIQREGELLPSTKGVL